MKNGVTSRSDVYEEDDERNVIDARDPKTVCVDFISFAVLAGRDQRSCDATTKKSKMQQSVSNEPM